MLVMPYPGIQGHTYKEESNDFVVGIEFQWNDFLLCFMILIRLVYVIRTTIDMSVYTDPRSQRVCQIFGAEANFRFALKAIMKEDSFLVLGVSMIITLVSFSYNLRLFERKVTSDFNNITTAFWNMLITMLTVGYGDTYPKSHMGRLMGIIIGIWGLFYTSLFVVAL